MKKSCTLTSYGTRLLSFLALSLLCFTCTFAQELVEKEKPLLTLACISDIHTERSLITDINSIDLRGSFTQTLKRIHEEEKIDVLLLGGDCTSDATIPYENWEKVRNLIVRYARTAFPSPLNTPAIYVTGNHDYEVANWDNLPKSYNAGDYYNYPMKKDIGELTAEESFYEDADNSTLGTMSLLAAYHYVIHGFDFVVLNCGKFQFKDAGHYEYSVESVQWVADKLEEIYAENPDKTVFFALHIPFSDSNSIRSASKGMVSSPGEKLLKSTLSKYPNLIMLYGHDHGEDKAYTRKKTSQRVTRYNKNGQVINTYDETHVDGELPEGYVPEDENVQSSGFYLRNISNNLYLGYNDYNLAVMENPTRILFDLTGTKTFNATIDAKHPTDPNGNSKLHIGSNGYFSGGTASAIYIYELETADNSLSGKRVETLEAGKVYAIVAKYNSNYYALSNKTYNSGSSQRMDRIQVTLSADLETMALTPANDAIKWSFDEIVDSQPATETTWTVCNASSGKYLGFNSANISVIDAVNASTFDLKNESTHEWSISVSGSGSEANGNYLYSGSSGRFSANSNPCPSYLYHVTQMDDTNIQAELASEIIAGEKYVIVVQNYKDNSQYYAVTDEVYNGNRLVGLLVNPSNGTLTLTASQANAVWIIDEMTEDNSNGSFFSAFMGSMRYYYNTIDPGDMPVETPNIVQALMVYVYADRVELHMKNYNKYGTINGITVNQYLVPFISYRKVDDPFPTHIKETSNELEDYYIENYKAFDISGREVVNPSQGFYIINGKKVFVK